MRSMPLPPAVDPEKVKAAFKNGILEVHLPKTKESKGKKVEIKVDVRWADGREERPKGWTTTGSARSSELPCGGAPAYYAAATPGPKSPPGPGKRGSKTRTSDGSSLRPMRGQYLLAPRQVSPPNGNPAHDGTITITRPDAMWGTDATRFYDETDGWFFGAIDHHLDELVHVAIEETRDRVCTSANTRAVVPLTESATSLEGVRMTRHIRVRLLGTGAAANEARHQACLLVGRRDEADEGPVLLDTGSGLDVVRQLVAVSCAPTAVRDIFVSHQHVDHIGGLEPLLLWSVVRALRDRGGPPKEETRVYGDPRVLSAIERLFEAVATAVPRLFGGKLRLAPVGDGDTMELRSGARLTTFLVDHQPGDGGAMGCQLELDGVRVAYSGDTRPTPRLIEAARSADLLVHEAGGLDAHAAEIHRQGHSTAGDAGRAAKAAGVARLVLTHLPSDVMAEAMLAEARDAFGGPVELARDLGLVEL